jgi:hypothetical protein
MEKKSKWKVMILPATLFVLAFALYVGYSLWENEQGNNVREIREAVAANSDRNEDIAVFQQESNSRDYKSVGSFISKFHEKYNQSLGWGGIDSIKWDEQRKIATEINTILAGIQTDISELQVDFDAISSYAKIIEKGKKDKAALLKLHRYFHDLDIELNGYKQTNDYFDVTEYKSSKNG